MKPFITPIALILLITASCGKYRKYDNLETTDTSFTGTITVSEQAGDLDVNYSGTDDSGAYGFIWDNPTKGAILMVDSLNGSGSVQWIIEDAKGNEILNAKTSGDAASYSIEGKKGKWRVRVVFTALNGSGRFDLNPIN